MVSNIIDSDTVQRLVDESAIRQVIATYNRGIDRLDAELLASVYHPDGIDDHGALFTGLGRKYAPFIVAHHKRTADATMHCTMNSSIDLDGDVAYVETYFFYVERKVKDGKPTVGYAGGRYVDRFERRDGKWAIAHRVAVREWDEIRVGAEPLIPEGVFTAGLRSRDDISYARKAD